MKRMINRLILIICIAWTGMGMNLAQSPTHIDTRQKEAKPFSLDDILLYIGAPLVMLILALWHRYRQNKKQQDKEQEMAREKEEEDMND